MGILTRSKKKKTPWPTKAAMEQVYDMKLWGSTNTPFYSGDGSHNTEIVYPYLEAIISFLQSFKTPLNVCDLGCGDFNIGKRLVAYSNKYTAVDIVPSLIEYNKKQYKAKNLEFHCIDIAKDELPSGDCAIIRQVLQHLSNKEVKSILNKLVSFKYVIITDHIPEGDFIPNKDIVSGQSIRLKKKSGLDLLTAPFGFKIEEKKVLCFSKLENNKGLIVTTLYRMF